MPIEVAGKTFFKANEAAEVAGVSRQTLWRWRKDKKVPAGRRYRDRELLYTQDEVEEIYSYAHRLEPGDVGDHFRNQLTLFS